LASGMIERRHPAVATRHVRKNNGLFSIHIRYTYHKSRCSAIAQSKRIALYSYSAIAL
jgi:hypothetical protein